MKGKPQLSGCTSPFGWLPSLDGRVEGGLEAGVCVTDLEWGVSLGTHKQRTPSEGSPLLRSWIGSCSIGDELSGGSCPIEDEPDSYPVWDESFGR